MGIFDFFKGSESVSLAEQRRAELHEMRMKTREERLKAIQNESDFYKAQMHVIEKQLNEDIQNLGNPYQMNMVGLGIDQLWKQGFPDVSTNLLADANYIASNDALRMDMVRLSRTLYDTHPHAKVIINTQVSYIVGEHAWRVEPSPKKPFPGEHSVQPVSEQETDFRVDTVGNKVAPVAGDVPFDFEKSIKLKKLLKKGIKALEDDGLKVKVQRLWTKYQRLGVIHPQMGYVEFWTEAYMRTRRDGEVFIYLGSDKKTGALAPRFIDPEEIVHKDGVTSSPSGIFDKYQNGVEVDPDDPCTVVAYWYRRKDNIAVTPRPIPADRIIHKKFGVDSNCRRGLPCFYVIRNFLKHFDRWLGQSLKHQDIQSRVAILRSWAKSTPGEVASLVEGKTFRQVTTTTPAGNTMNYRTNQLFPVVDAPANMELKGFTPSGNYSDSEILARRILLACAAGSGLSEAMITADGSNANYASTRITNFLPFQDFKKEKGVWGELAQKLYEEWLYKEAACGRINRALTQESLDCNVTPSRLPNFEAEIVSQTVIGLFTAEIISKRTAQEWIGVDPEIEEERITEEKEVVEIESDELDSKLGIGTPLDEEPELEDGEAEELEAESDPELEEIPANGGEA